MLDPKHLSEVEWQAIADYVNYAIKEQKSEEKKEEHIIVPFKFEWDCGSGDNIGIPFNKHKQVLLYSVVHNIWRVNLCVENYLTACRLASEPTPHDELKVGYTYFACTGTCVDDYLGDIIHYTKYIGNGKCVYVDYHNTISRHNVCYDVTYYQVIPVDEQ